MIMNAKKGKDYDTHCLICLTHKKDVVQLTIRRADGNGITGFCCCKDCLKIMGQDIREILHRSGDGSIQCKRKNCSLRSGEVCGKYSTNDPNGVIVEEKEMCEGIILKEDINVNKN